MQTSDQPIWQRNRTGQTSFKEFVLAMLLFASLGAITWAIRGTNGWGGMDGTLLPGLTWGILWWYLCWRKGIDARGIPLWLGLGITLGGELGYGQYVNWIQGVFMVGDEVIDIPRWVGYLWFAICGIGWAAPGGIALGWALRGRVSLGHWLARLVFPLGIAILTRIFILTCPRFFFPYWELGIYTPSEAGTIDLTAAANTQWTMILCWIIAAGLFGLAVYITRKTRLPHVFPVIAIMIGTVLLLPVAQWLFFPGGQMGMFDGPLDKHQARTVYTNSQNAIVVGWWIGALLVALFTRDRQTHMAGMIIGGGFGILFPLSTVWCHGYEFSPNFIDWWKMWELNSGFYLGPLYVVVLYWSLRHPHPSESQTEKETSRFQQITATASQALGAFLIIYVATRDYFLEVGLLLGAFYVAALGLTLINSKETRSQRQAITFVYSLFLLIFMLTWGASAQGGIVLGLYDAEAVDDYQWPWERIWLFLPFAVLIIATTLFTIRKALHEPNVGLLPYSEAKRVNARLIDLMTFTGVVGAISIWPAKIGVLYAVFLGLAIFAFTRLDLCLDHVDCIDQQDC
ncbi:MAG: hypothetical protein KDA65_15670 [Planctomycetaceae bacterium]|nr:hypothetical protein [Planctomycetaceae bacterium]